MVVAYDDLIIIKILPHGTQQRTLKQVSPIPLGYFAWV